MVRRIAVQLGAVAVVGWVMWASCSVYNEGMFQQPLDDVSTGGTGATEAGETGVGGCATSEQPPDPPAASDPGADVRDIVVAMQTIDFGEPVVVDGSARPFREFGYDLDGKCTYTENNVLHNTSCLTPKFATAVQGCTYCGQQDDFPNGRDNNHARMIAEVSQRVAGFGSGAYNAQIEQGKVSLLWVIKGYNGQPNDDQVELTLLTPAAMSNQANSQRTTPEWDGLDVWPIAADSLNLNTDGQPDINNPKFRDPKAYVRDGVIVASLNQADLRLRIGISASLVVELLLSYKQAFFTAEIKQVPKTVASVDGGTKTELLWVLEKGQIAGRWLVNDLVNQLDQFPDPNNLSKPLCMTSGAYPRFREIVCSFVDICGALCSPTDPCNAISLGMGFHAEQALLGNIYQLQPLQDRCPGEPPDDCFNPVGDGGLIDSGAGGTGGSGTDGGAAAAGAAGAP